MENEKSNILYVDDEPNNLTSFVATFRRYYNIFTAGSAREAMEVMRHTKMKVVITDQRMPEMTGVQFLEAIIPEYPRTVRIILTGFTDVEAIIKAINTGRVFRYINKPWDPNELKINIDTGIRIYDLEQDKQDLIEKLNQEVLYQKRIMELFQKYVPENIVREALGAYGDETSIHGEYRIISVMFVDIREFTPTAQKLGPEKSVELLNKYFTLMSLAVRKYSGSVNKFLGDGILALFGAPVSHIENQSNAVFCGLAMLDSLKELNADFAEIVGHDLAIGIGIHTGEVIAGNVGTSDHVEYTVLGDTVNTAARIEDLTREMPNTLLISESTYKATKDQILVEELGPQTLRGKEGKIMLYKVLGKKNA